MSPRPGLSVFLALIVVAAAAAALDEPPVVSATKAPANPSLGVSKNTAGTSAARMRNNNPGTCDPEVDSNCAKHPGTGHYADMGDLTGLVPQCGWYNFTTDTMMWDAVACEKLIIGFTWWTPLPVLGFFVLLIAPIFFLVARFVFDSCGGRLPNHRTCCRPGEDEDDDASNGKKKKTKSDCPRREPIRIYHPVIVRRYKIAFIILCVAFFVMAVLAGVSSRLTFWVATDEAFPPLPTVTAFAQPYSVISPVIASTNDTLVWAKKANADNPDANTSARALKMQMQPATPIGQSETTNHEHGEFDGFGIAERYAFPATRTRHFFTPEEMSFLMKVQDSITDTIDAANTKIKEMRDYVLWFVGGTIMMSVLCLVGSVLGVVFAALNIGVGLAAVQAVISWGTALSLLASLTCIIFIRIAGVACSVFDSTLIPSAMEYAQNHDLCLARMSDYGDNSTRSNETTTSIATAVEARFIEASHHKRSATCVILEHLCKDTKPPKNNGTMAWTPLTPALTSAPKIPVPWTYKPPADIDRLLDNMPPVVHWAFTCPANPCKKPRPADSRTIWDLNTTMSKSTLKLGGFTYNISIGDIATGAISESKIDNLIGTFSGGSARTDSTTHHFKVLNLIVATNIPRYTNQLTPVVSAMNVMSSLDQHCNVIYDYMKTTVRPRVCNSNLSQKAHFAITANTILLALAFPILFIAIRGIKRFRSERCCPVEVDDDEEEKFRTEEEVLGEDSSTRDASNTSASPNGTRSGPKVSHRTSPQGANGGTGANDDHEALAVEQINIDVGGQLGAAPAPALWRTIGSASRHYGNDDLDTLGGHEMTTLVRPSLQVSVTSASHALIANRNGHVHSPAVFPLRDSFRDAFNEEVSPMLGAEPAREVFSPTGVRRAFTMETQPRPQPLLVRGTSNGGAESAAKASDIHGIASSSAPLQRNGVIGSADGDVLCNSGRALAGEHSQHLSSLGGAGGETPAGDGHLSFPQILGGGFIPAPLPAPAQGSLPVAAPAHAMEVHPEPTLAGADLLTFSGMCTPQRAMSAPCESALLDVVPVTPAAASPPGPVVATTPRRITQEGPGHDGGREFRRSMSVMSDEMSRCVAHHPAAFSPKDGADEIDVCEKSGRKRSVTPLRRLGARQGSAYLVDVLDGQPGSPTHGADVMSADSSQLLTAAAPRVAPRPPVAPAWGKSPTTSPEFTGQAGASAWRGLPPVTAMQAHAQQARVPGAFGPGHVPAAAVNPIVAAVQQRLRGHVANPFMIDGQPSAKAPGPFDQSEIGQSGHRMNANPFRNVVQPVANFNAAPRVTHPWPNMAPQAPAFSAQAPPQPPVPSWRAKSPQLQHQQQQPFTFRFEAREEEMKDNDDKIAVVSSTTDATSAPSVLAPSAAAGDAAPDAGPSTPSPTPTAAIAAGAVQSVSPMVAFRQLSWEAAPSSAAPTTLSVGPLTPDVQASPAPPSCDAVSCDARDGVSTLSTSTPQHRDALSALSQRSSHRAPPRCTLRWALATRHRRNARREAAKAAEPKPPHLKRFSVCGSRSSSSLRRDSKSSVLAARLSASLAAVSLVVSPLPASPVSLATPRPQRASRLARAFLAALSSTLSAPRLDTMSQQRHPAAAGYSYSKRAPSALSKTVSCSTNGSIFAPPSPLRHRRQSSLPRRWADALSAASVSMPIPGPCDVSAQSEVVKVKDGLHEGVNTAVVPVSTADHEECSSKDGTGPIDPSADVADCDGVAVDIDVEATQAPEGEAPSEQTCVVVPSTEVQTFADVPPTSAAAFAAPLPPVQFPTPTVTVGVGLPRSPAVRVGPASLVSATAPTHPAGSNTAGGFAMPPSPYTGVHIGLPLQHAGQAAAFGAPFPLPTQQPPAPPAAPPRPSFLRR